MNRRPRFPFNKLNNYSALLKDVLDPFSMLGKSDESESDAGSSTDEENHPITTEPTPDDSSILYQNKGWDNSSSTTAIGVDENFLKSAVSYVVLNLKNGFIIKYPQSAFCCSVIDEQCVKLTPERVGTLWTVQVGKDSIYISGDDENRIFVEAINDISLGENVKVEIEESVITLKFVEVKP